MDSSRPAEPSPELDGAVSTLVDLLRWRAGHQPDRHAYTFLAGDGEDGLSITYGQLDRRARTIGAWLQSSGFAGERALLLYPSGLEYVAAFFGCLYADVVAVPAYPPRQNRGLARITAIMADARARLALTTTPILRLVERQAAEDGGATGLRCVATDCLPDDLDVAWQPPLVSGRSLAFLQYTSGSTDSPKGVMLSHANLLANLAVMARASRLDAEDRGVSWLPPYHDMGIVAGILEPMYVGFPCTLMSPTSFLQNPLRWLQTISRTRATVSGGPDFAYALCLRATTPDERAGLDLSSWRQAFTAAEPIRDETLKQFAAAFEPSGFRPEAFSAGYGLAEATLLVSGGLVGSSPRRKIVDRASLEQHRLVPGVAGAGAHDTQTLVGCGPVPAENRVVVVHPETLTTCPPGRVGEIWVAGPSVAQGYWNRPTETRVTFQADVADTGEGPFLRTGDLGFVEDGELFVTGRQKDLIIIRGRNHYPQDIELTVEKAHPALRPSYVAAFSVEVAEEERLVVVQEVKRHHRSGGDEVVAAIRQAVAEHHDLHVHAVALIRTGTIPKTSSGKIQRKACRAEFLSGSLDVVASSVLAQADPLDGQGGVSLEALRAAGDGERRPLMEAYLREQVARVLRTTPASVDPGQPLLTLGLDSLMGVELKQRIEVDLVVALPLSKLHQVGSLADLAEWLSERAPTGPVAENGAAVPTALVDRADGVDAQRLLGELDRLSDAEVDRLLSSLLAAPDAAS
jgi:acyl-CoA synthetase (AMP-forming)/AMP-acid ligase II/aryl carrier-like protein